MSTRCKPRVGRPPLDPLQRAAAQILIRCTYADRETLREAAEREGAPLSEWIRDTCLRAARKA